MTALRQNAWYFVSAYLLVVYLAYFHWLNIATAEQVSFIGAGFTAVWLVSCFVFQNVFRNRFEFAIHVMLALDFHLESLVPRQAGLGFYFCAAGFWAVFLIYHHWPIQQRAAEAPARP